LAGGAGLARERSDVCGDLVRDREKAVAENDHLVARDPLAHTARQLFTRLRRNRLPRGKGRRSAAGAALAAMRGREYGAVRIVGARHVAHSGFLLLAARARGADRNARRIGERAAGILLRAGARAHSAQAQKARAALGTLRPAPA